MSPPELELTPEEQSLEDDLEDEQLLLFVEKG